MSETATSPALHRSPPSTSASSTRLAAKGAKTPSVSHTMPPFAQPHPRLATPLERHASHPKTPSPNYFSIHTNDAADADVRPQWSPPSSAVRSTAAASPSVVPVDGNPAFDAFKRQSESSKAFDLGGLGGNFKMNAPPTTANRATPVRIVSKHASGQSATSTKTAPEPRNLPLLATRAGSVGSLDPAMAELARSPKRVLSPGSVAQLEPVRKGSPATFNKSGEPEQAQSEQKQDPSQALPRFNLPLDNKNGPHSFAKVQRAETLPETSASTTQQAEQLLVTPQHIINLMDSKTEEIMLLDLRVSTMYATSHVSGALNLCIPTTLLKRPSFNVHKLAETFKNEDQRNKFENWRNSSYIIVYDNASSQLKDAAICLNTIKKFQGEGYDGTLYIIRGGFLEFKKRFPKYTEAAASTSTGGQRFGGGPGFLEGPKIAPVIGGCPMPGTDRPANPFFGNIRQNMDLIGGVGQIPLKHPETKSAGRHGRKGVDASFPTWLKKAAETNDQGKAVAGKFEAIERREKKRMEDALSGQVSYGQPPSAPNKNQTSARKSDIQIAGIEKGDKNRYNNIWPFEHSRVKLQNVPRETGCDYFNANYIQAAWSPKRYISTQAPIPGTFADFWNVVWEQDVRVIVMLTAEKEGAQVKAHCYWEGKEFGGMRLEFLSEKRASLEPERIRKHRQQQQQEGSAARPGVGKRTETRSMHPQIPLATLDPAEVTKAGEGGDGSEGAGGEQPFCIVRKFMLRNERQPFAQMREVTQLQFASWPDFGAPAHPKHLLGLVEQTDAVVRASSQAQTYGAAGGGGGGVKATEPEVDSERPVLVHCSAGCGRTGTFCTVDSVIDMLKRQKAEEKSGKSSHGQGRQGMGEGSGAGMDVDAKSPAAKSGTRHSKTDSKLSGPNTGGGGGDFFSSKDHSKDTNMDRDSNSATNTKSVVQTGQEDLDEKWLHSQEVDLVEKTVEEFRNQRLSMVQSLRQYVLCYESVMEWLDAGSLMEGGGH